ncbi:winged helix-turn-helix transcriptional regulator [Cupriavidus sp. KK10]|uniref:winged helix-turn-helix transcriptional regulator n=1 Tax=Cupriavidus sp. KK10 TaxID=1478019 RepID=UPI00353029DE
MNLQRRDLAASQDKRVGQHDRATGKGAREPGAHRDGGAMVILFHLFGGQVRRFSDLERLIPGITQKMLAQQLRHLEEDGIVTRTVYHQVPPKVDYRLTDWGQALCPALDAILKWAERREDFPSAASSVRA